MKKMSSIGQFRQMISNIRKHQEYIKDTHGIEPPLPIVKAYGTIKLHGTNAGFELSGKGHHFQSKNNVLTLQKDNAGFCAFGETNLEQFKRLANHIANICEIDVNATPITLFGEWCGNGIQKSVAINELPKMWVFFSVSAGGKSFSFFRENGDERFPLDDELKTTLNESRIYSIGQFPNYTLDIDLSNPKMVQNDLINITNEVESECPVGKYFGVSGTGEGVVWEFVYDNTRHRFKVKGEKHSATKVKKLVTVDPVQLENAKKFVEYAVTENRLEQGYNEFMEEGERTRKNTGDFIRWVINDVVKEESDTLLANGLIFNDIKGELSKRSSKWYLDKVDKVDL